MTRPLTRPELALQARARSRDNQADLFLGFIIGKAVLGASLGAVFALMLVLSDAFGMLSLLRDVSDPIGHVAAFLVGGVMIFTPVTIAVAVALAPYSE